MSCHQWQACGHTVSVHFSHHLLCPHPHHSLLWGREDAVGKKNNPCYTSGPFAYLGWLLIVYTSHYGHWARLSKTLLISLLRALVDHDPPQWPLPSPTCVINLCRTNWAIWINSGDYGYGNVNWFWDLCGIWSYGTVSLPLWWYHQNMASMHMSVGCHLDVTKYNLLI